MLWQNSNTQLDIGLCVLLIGTWTRTGVGNPIIPLPGLVGSSESRHAGGRQTRCAFARCGGSGAGLTPVNVAACHPLLEGGWLSWHDLFMLLTLMVSCFVLEGNVTQEATVFDNR